ncbi:MAG: family 16 glycosylhydrolase [Novosphingobium sp.]
MLPSGQPIPTAQAATTLPQVDLRDMRLWNWGGKWIGSQWNNNFSTIPWRFDHIVRKGNGDIAMVLDPAGAPELQAGGGQAAHSSGLWETEVTLPPMRDGLVVAPLWLYDTTSKEEVDFEFPGRNGLDVSLHTYPNGVHTRTSTKLFSGQNFSGKRVRFGIRINQATKHIDMLVNGVVAHSWDGATTKSMPSHAMKPWLETWAANPSNSGFVGWAGKWTGVSASTPVVLTVHGYGYAP